MGASRGFDLDPVALSRGQALALKGQRPQRTDHQTPGLNGGAEASTPPAPPSFVEVQQPPVQPQVLGGLEVELQRTDGARLRIHSPDASLPLAAIVHSFLEAR